MVSLPDEIVDKIKLYLSHPCADIMRDFYDVDVEDPLPFRIDHITIPIMELNQVGNTPYLKNDECSGTDIIDDDYHYFYALMLSEDYYDIPTRRQGKGEDCNCIKRGGRKKCLRDFNCNYCGVCLNWKGYEEGTLYCNYICRNSFVN